MPSGLSQNNYYIDNTKILYPNFRGIESEMNRKGDRNFSIIIPTQELADLLKADGYNVKKRKAAEATDEYEAREETFFLPVKLGFNGKKPPRVVMITCKTADSCVRSNLTEDIVGLLDTADISSVDCKIGPYDWKQNGGGRTAYVQSLFVTVELDKYDEKYDDMPYADGSPSLPDNFDPNDE